MLGSVTAFLKAMAPQLLPGQVRAPNAEGPKIPDLSKTVPIRPPSFCTGCPERPIFAALKLVEKELGKHQITADIGCHLFATLPPFEIGGSTMGYGLGPASNAAFDGGGERRPLSIIGDGGFWHNGLSTSIGNMVFNRSDSVAVVVDNYYSAATGGQDVMSSRADNASKATKNPIAKAVQGIGVKWVRQVDHTYDVGHMRDVFREALTTKEKGPKVIIASSECMLNRQRREKPLQQQAIREGRRVEVPRFGVDEAVCTGDHACIRLSGCPSLGLKRLDDPLRDDPVASIDQSCVGCGNCGEVADAAVLCPSFYRADVVHNPGGFELWRARISKRFIGWLMNRRAKTSDHHGSEHMTLHESFASRDLDPSLGGIIKLAVMAVGGQGGGVLGSWIEDLARSQWLCSSGNICRRGGAKRTGSTIYYTLKWHQRVRKAAESSL
jgi:indolepyruvate ferredoxin oxidoreductase alpha subunit